jgi:porin
MNAVQVIAATLAIVLASPAVAQNDPTPPPPPEPAPAPKDPEPEPDPEPPPAEEQTEQEKTKEARTPPAESGDDISGHLEEAAEVDAQEQEETKQEQEETKQEQAPPPESGDDVAGQLDEAKEAAKATGDEAPDDEEEVEGPPPPPAEELAEERVESELESGDNVTGTLDEVQAPPRAGLFKHGPVSDLQAVWVPLRRRIRERTGLELGLAYTTLAQIATRGPGLRNAWSGDVDLFGKWNLINQDQPGTGSAGFLFEQRHRLGQVTPDQLNDAVGSLWRTTKGFNTQDGAIVQLWWEQFLFDDHLRITAGKIDPANFYNGNRFQSQNTFFVNRAFSENPARGFPNNGIGVNFRLAGPSETYLSFGLHDVNGSKTSSGFGDLDKDALFYAFEIGLTPEVEGLGPGRFRATAWYRSGGNEPDESGDSRDDESGAGFAFSAEQDLGNGVIPFLRYGYQDRNVRATRQILSGGLGIQGPLGRVDNILGIGVAWGEPSDRSLRDQYVTEIFYRLQVTPNIQVTPGYQVIFDPSQNPDQDVVGVFQLRVRVVF